METKLYFKDEDSTFCESLDDLLQEAKDDGFTEIEIFEAIPDNDNKEFIFCKLHGEVGGRSECKKSLCYGYKSKSGRGVCSNRGNLFTFGNKIKFKVD